jgi:recombinational DNA repair protein RecR
MGCCGKPNNRARKSGANSYYERYAYLSSRQQQKAADLGIAHCKKCGAYTSGDPCTICGTPKKAKEEAS